MAQLQAALEAERAATGRRPIPGQAVFRHAFVPVLLAVAVLGWRQSPAAGPASLLACILLVWVAEQLYPARAEWNVRPLSDGLRGLRQLTRDFVYLFGVTQLTALAILGADAHLKPAVEGLRLGFGVLWPTGLPFGAKVALAFLLIEFGSYWFHRAAHRFRPLWQFHSTHHVVTELTGLKALRTHPVDNLLFHVCRTLPLVWLGAGAGEVVAALYFGGVLGVLAHANLRPAEGYLALTVNLPQVHALHHTSDVQRGSANFGCHTLLWDRVFRTYRRHDGNPVEVGVHPVRPRSLWQELAWPFYRSVG